MFALRCLILCLLAMLGGAASAAPATSCPPLGTLPGFEANSAGAEVRDYDAVAFRVQKPGSEETDEVEVRGQRCFLSYYPAEGSSGMSDLEIQSNFRAQLAQLGAQVTARDERNTWAHLARDGAETWVHVYSQETAIELQVVRKTAHRQVLTPPSGKDYRLLGHMPGFSADGEVRERNFDEAEFTVQDGDSTRVVKVQGKLHEVNYSPQEGAPLRSSDLDIQQNYRNALAAIGGEVLFADARNTTARLLDRGTTVWVKVYSQETGIQLIAVEEKPFAASIQPPAADALKAALDRDGRVALYVNFDFAKATLRPDAQPVLAQVVALLRADPALQLAVEGHTDNVGADAANRALSEQRAQAVVTALVQGGVAPARLTAAGFGAARPLASNDSSEGRAQNRRVELVKR